MTATALRLLLASGALALAASHASAQAPTPDAAARLRARLVPGAAVRLEAPGLVVDGGLVVRTTPDSLVLREASTSVAVALSEVVRLSLQRDRALQGALMGAGMGFFVGAATGAIDGYTACGPRESCAGEAVRRAGLYGAAAALPSALVGWLLGRRARLWEQVLP